MCREYVNVFASELTPFFLVIVLPALVLESTICWKHHLLKAPFVVLHLESRSGFRCNARPIQQFARQAICNCFFFFSMTYVSVGDTRPLHVADDNSPAASSSVPARFCSLTMFATTRCFRVRRCCRPYFSIHVRDTPGASPSLTVTCCRSFPVRNKLCGAWARRHSNCTWTGREQC